MIHKYASRLPSRWKSSKVTGNFIFTFIILVFKLIDAGSKHSDRKFLFVSNEPENEFAAHPADNQQSFIKFRKVTIIPHSFSCFNSFRRKFRILVAVIGFLLRRIKLWFYQIFFQIRAYPNWPEYFQSISCDNHCSSLQSNSGTKYLYSKKINLLVLYSTNSKFLIVRFETETEAFMAYRDLDGLLIKDMYNGKLIKRLKANLYWWIKACEEIRSNQLHFS